MTSRTRTKLAHFALPCTLSHSKQFPQFSPLFYEVYPYILCSASFVVLASQTTDFRANGLVDDARDVFRP